MSSALPCGMSGDDVHQHDIGVVALGHPLAHGRADIAGADDRYFAAHRCCSFLAFQVHGSVLSGLVQGRRAAPCLHARQLFHRRLYHLLPHDWRLQAVRRWPTIGGWQWVCYDSANNGPRRVSDLGGATMSTRDQCDQPARHRLARWPCCARTDLLWASRGARACAREHAARLRSGLRSGGRRYRV